MPLVNLNEAYKKANKEFYAIGHFNINNLEFLQSALIAADELKSPIIVAASSSAIEYAGIGYLVAMARSGAEKIAVPVALHLDHGADFEIAKKCIDAGFTSVMIDGSHHLLAENIALTKKVVEYAHPRKVTVEAELGRLGGIEDNINVNEKDARLTDPAEAKEFVEKSGVDALAVAVGTSHGAYKFKGDAKLAIERIAEIKKLVNIPLVLHGSSGVDPAVIEKASKFGAILPGAKGVPADSIIEAVKRGINKVNIDTDLRLTWVAAVREILATKPEEFDPRKILGPARKAVSEVVKMKIKLLGSAGKA
jgi:fructose-bisphosphate aldolase, class II